MDTMDKMPLCGTRGPKTGSQTTGAEYIMLKALCMYTVESSEQCVYCAHSFISASCKIETAIYCMLLKYFESNELNLCNMGIYIDPHKNPTCTTGRRCM